MDAWIPSREDLEDLASNLQVLVSLAGPMAPPGRERALAVQELWPRFLEVEMAHAAQDGEDVFATLPRHRQGDQAIVVQGWGVDVRYALYQARSALREVLRRWGLKPMAEWGEDEDGAGPQSDAPLVLDDELHDELRWANNILVGALQDEDPPTEPTSSPEPDVLRKLAADLKCENFGREAGIVNLLIDREWVPIGDDYYRAVHKGRKVQHGAVRQAASLATFQARTRGVPIRYRGEADRVRRIPPPSRDIL